MEKIMDEHSKSIDDIYMYINLIEGHLKDLESRVSDLENNAECDNYDK